MTGASCASSTGDDLTETNIIASALNIDASDARPRSRGPGTPHA